MADLVQEQQPLQKHYETTLDWLNKFYERRDKNFALYVAIHVAFLPQEDS